MIFNVLIFSITIFALIKTVYLVIFPDLFLSLTVLNLSTFSEINILDALGEELSSMSFFK